MRFRLILKQAFRDFKSKLQLYVSFCLFLIVCLSIIIGMLTFANTYGGFFNGVFNDNGNVPNTYLPSFKFVNKNIFNDPDKKNDDNNNFRPDKNNYMQDQGDFEKFIYEDLLVSDQWGSVFDKDQIQELQDQESKHDVNSLVNLIGKYQGNDNYSLISTFYNNASKDDISWADNHGIGFNSKDGKPTIKDTDKLENNFRSALSDNPGEWDLKYLALIKLNRIANPSLDQLVQNKNLRFFNSNLLNKFMVEKTSKKSDINGQFEFHINLSYGTQMTWNNKFEKVGFSIAPGLIDEDTPWQLQKKNTAGFYVEEKLKTSKIPDDVIKNQTYAYVTPSFMHHNGYKLGDKIKVPSSTTDNDAYDELTIIGSAITPDTYFRDLNNGVIFMSIKELNKLSPIDEFERNKQSQIPYYGSNGWLGNWWAYDTKSNHDTKNARNDAAKFLTQDFYNKETGSYDKTVNGNDFFPVGEIYDVREVMKTNVDLFTLLTYMISLGVVILSCIVFWFIASETIKLQKNTLWFLKALGENRMVLSLLTTLSVMVPYLIAAVLAIFGSIGVTWIMNSAVSFNYAFWIPGWTFNWFSLLVLIVVTVASFGIFLLLNILNLSSRSLSLHSDQKVGLITRIYIKTKPIYSKLPAGTRIGISFVVQNIFKNLLTLVLLLLSFGVVLFAMQFSSSARASAHSYENRNKPYTSLMMNKLNSNDALSLDKNYVSNNYGKLDSNSEINNDKLNEISSLLTLIYGQQYQSSVVNSWKDDEGSIASQVFNTPLYSGIDNNEEFNGQLILSINDIVKYLYNPEVIPNGRNALFNKYLTQKYMKDTLLKSDVSPSKIADEIFKYKDFKSKPTWWTDDSGLPTYSDNIDLTKVLLNDICDKSKRDKVINNIGKIAHEANDKYNNGDTIADRIKHSYVDGMIDEQISDLKSEADDLVNNHIANNQDEALDDIHKAIDSGKAYFANMIIQTRSAFSMVKSGLGVKEIPLNIYFNRTILPKDSSSVYSADLGYKGWDKFTGFGMDYRDKETYNRLVSPYGKIDEATEKDLNSKVKYSYKDVKGNNQEIKVHVIHAYISGKLSKWYNFHDGDVIQLKAIKSPLANQQIPYVFIKVDGIVKESSIYNEVYFNKADYFNYLQHSLEDSWNNDVDRQLEDNARKINSAVKLNAEDDIKNKNRKIRSAVFNWAALERQNEELKGIVNNIKNDDANAPYYLNNSVYSRNEIPYSLKHLTLGSKVGVGYTLLDYVSLPMIKYSSDMYPENYNNDIYIFKLITARMMNTVQPMITTMNRFVALLLIVTFVVAVILINLVLLQNRQTILLFKAMGYKKRELNGYLLSGYIVADCLGLAAGIMIAYFGIDYVSSYTIAHFNISLFAVWSWQFILTAALMAIVFIVMILGAVTWYTNKQKPRDAFATL